MQFVSYHDKGAVKVEALAAAFGHHEPRPAVAVAQHGDDEQQQVKEGVHSQEQQLPAVVLPVGPGKVARGLTLLLVQIRRLQPVSSAEGKMKNRTGV